ncbi:proteoglycan 4-like [Juglans microcarpa x Juglans regia]|uniref:proteoglycan 4-like n=1 Tax=Juglans microcarpa x Juglans regia TaxID=2249226 RepID=UPI001B7E340A|nr:proteoglycan 4-like [Juglans microcarpa x Juglans regia]
MLDLPDKENLSEGIPDMSLPPTKAKKQEESASFKAQNNAVRRDSPGSTGPPLPQAQVPQRTEPQPSEPVPQSRAGGSVPSSPSRTSQIQPASGTSLNPPWSPSRNFFSQPTGLKTSQPTGATTLQPTPEPAPQSRAAGSVPSSPSRTSQIQPASGTSLNQPWSPSRNFFSQPTGLKTSQPTGATTLQSTIQESSQPTLTATQPPSSLSEKEPKPVVSQKQTPVETSSQLDGVVTRPKKVFLTTDQPQKSDSDAIGGDAKPKSEEREGEKKVVRGITEERTSAAFQAKEKPKPEKEETFDRKEAIYSASSSAKQINTTSSKHPKDRKISSKSTTQKPSTVVSDGEQLPPHEEVRKDILKYLQKLTTSYPIDEKPVSVITIAGGNEGASMHLGLEWAEKEGKVHIQRGYKLNPTESTEATADGEGSSKAKRSENPITKENPPSRAYVNSNVQSVNNSMLFDNSITERNPGVQLVVSNEQKEPVKSSGKPEALETRKAESNITPPEKLTYEPTVERQCLMTGLFVEPTSSDSDPDNAGKPRRHGSETDSVGKTDKEKEIGIL